MRKPSYVFFFLLVLLVAACGKDKNASQNPTTESQTITSLDQITQTPNRESLVGRKVEIASVRGQRPTGTYVFWAGEGHDSVPVVRFDRMHGPVSEHVTEGARVRISGTVRDVRNTPDNDPMWDKINDRERADIKSAIIYIGADTVQILH